MRFDQLRDNAGRQHRVGQGVALDGAGNIYVTTGNNVVEWNTTTVPTLAFATTTTTQTSSDNPRTVTLSNIGNASLSITAKAISTGFYARDGRRRELLRNVYNWDIGFRHELHVAGQLHPCQCRFLRWSNHRTDLDR